MVKFSADNVLALSGQDLNPLHNDDGFPIEVGLHMIADLGNLFLLTSGSPGFGRELLRFLAVNLGIRIVRS